MIGRVYKHTCIYVCVYLGVWVCVKKRGGDGMILRDCVFATKKDFHLSFSVLVFFPSFSHPG